VSLDSPQHHDGDDQEAAATTGEDPWPDTADHRGDGDSGEESTDTQGRRDHGGNDERARLRSHDRTLPPIPVPA